MSNRIELSPKLVGETRTVVWNYLSQLGQGETVVSAAASAAVWTGTDPSPSAILSGSPSVSSPIVTQLYTAGVAGTIYLLTMAGTTSAGQIIELQALLAVVAGP